MNHSVLYLDFGPLQKKNTTRKNNKEKVQTMADRFVTTNHIENPALVLVD